MAKLPAIMFWTDAWVADTHHLTRLERGTYFDLLVLMWLTPGCSVPNNDIWLSRHLRMTPEEVTKDLRPIIAEYCKSDGNRLYQKRLRFEYLRAREKCQKQSDRANSRWHTKKDDAAAIPTTTTTTATKKERKKGVDPVAQESCAPGPTIISPDGRVEVPRPTSSGEQIVFEALIIRLTQKGMNSWYRAYPHLALEAELYALAEWASQQARAGHNWFFAVASALAKKERRAKIEFEQTRIQAQQKVRGDPSTGYGWDDPRGPPGDNWG